MSYTVSILVRAVDRASGVLRGLGSSISALEARLGSLSGLALAFADVAGDLALAALDRLAQAADACVEAYARFEWVLVRVATATGALGEGARVLAGQMGELARRVGVELGVGAVRAAEALESLVKAGLAGEEATRALEATLKLAQIELIGAGEAADYVAGILRMFSLSADQAERVVDALVNASIRGIGTARDFALALTYCGTTASLLGLSLEETLAALVKINNAGIEAYKAGRYLDAMLRALIEHSDELGFSIYDARGRLLPLAEILARLEARLAEFATEEERNAYLMRIFGAQGMRAASALLLMSAEGRRGSEILAELAEAMGEAGTASAVFGEQQATLAGTLARARARVLDAMLAVGEKLAPAIEKSSELASKLVQAVGELLAPELVGFVEEFTRVLSAFEDYLAKDRDAAEGLRITLSLLAKALYYLAYAAFQLVGALVVLGKLVKLAADGFSWFGRACSSAVLAMSSAFSSAWEAAQAFLSQLEGALASLSASLASLAAAWQELWSLFASAIRTSWAAVGPVISAFLKALEAIRKAIEQLLDALGGALDAIRAFFGGVVEAAEDLYTALVGGSVWPDMLADMEACLARSLRRMEEMASGAFRRLGAEAEGGLELLASSLAGLGHAIGIRVPGGAPVPVLPAPGTHVSLSVHVHVGHLHAREPSDLAFLARELGRLVARELRLRGVVA